jgi:hypothetical protein
MSIHHLDAFRYWFGDPDSIFCSVRNDPRTKFPHGDGICAYILEYGNGLRCAGLDDTWTGPAKEGCPSDIYIRWRIEGLNGLAIGDIGWCKDPYTTPSTIRYASKGHSGFECPIWKESWFPDAFIGTMAQLLIAVEDRTEPAIGGRDNLRTMALVEAAYQSATQGRTVPPQEIEDAHRSKVARVSKSSLTPNAEQTLRLAREEAARSRSAETSAEHVLLGMLQLFHCTASRALQASGVGLDEIRKRIADGEGVKQSAKGRPAQESIDRLLQRAAAEAQNLHHQHLSTGHLLLALLRDGNSLPGRVLRNLGLTLPDATKAVLKELDPNRSN